MTYREYQQQRNAITSTIATREAEVTAACAGEGALDTTGINRLHDEITDLEKTVTALDSSWRTRRWRLGVEWTTYQLVAQNAD